MSALLVGVRRRPTSPQFGNDCGSDVLSLLSAADAEVDRHAWVAGTPTSDEASNHMEIDDCCIVSCDLPCKELANDIEPNAC
mmetsp:Transcript_65586/g.128960  ORF Transcript_65586/g.128960 Transcript_65586/m.128960 type:complete len:82 (-) Transcript_65586:12-257(-)